MSNLAAALAESNPSYWDEAGQLYKHALEDRKRVV